MPSTKSENATEVAVREYSPMVQVITPLLRLIDGAKLGSMGGTNTGAHNFVFPVRPAETNWPSVKAVPQYVYWVSKGVSAKAPLPMLVTELGIVTEVREVLLPKA